MEMTAVIALRIKVPFSYDASQVQEPNRENGPLDPTTNPNAQDVLDSQDAHEKEVLDGRINAAMHAESELVDTLKKAIGDHGEVVEAVVEEVSEA